MARTLAAVSAGSRPFLAVEHAPQTVLESFSYVVDLGAWGVPRDLSWRALRLLSAFGVLVRAGEFGYLGTAVPMEALAAFVGRVVHTGAHSLPTVRRALGELRAAGYVRISYYGGGRPRAFADSAGGVYWRKDQTTVVTFTPKLVSVFKKPTPAPVSIRVSKCKRDDLPKVPQDGETSSARDVGTCSGSPAVAAAGSFASLSSAVSLALLPTLDGDCIEGETSKGRARIHGAKPFKRADRARLVLAAIVLACEHKGRAGRAVAARASLELSDPCAAASVPWDYWLAQWGNLTPTERRSVVRREMLPGLLAGLGQSIAAPLPSPRLSSAPRADAPRAAPPVAAPVAPCDLPEMLPGEALRAYWQRCADLGLEFARDLLR